MGKYVPKRIVKKNAIEIVPVRTLSNGEEEVKETNEDVEKEKIRKRVGLTYELLCQTVKEGLVAETAIVDGNGKVVSRVPANSERAKFIAVATEILGAKKSETPAQKCPRIVIELPNGQIWKLK